MPAGTTIKTALMQTYTLSASEEEGGLAADLHFVVLVEFCEENIHSVCVRRYLNDFLCVIVSV